MIYGLAILFFVTSVVLAWSTGRLMVSVRAERRMNDVANKQCFDLIDRLFDLQHKAPDDWFAQVLAFHQKFDAPIQPFPTVTGVTSCGINLRIKLMEEEVAETATALRESDLVEIADGLADTIYIALGTAICYGIDLRPVFAEVHASNMRKVPYDCVLAGMLEAQGKKIPMGKILKPPGWVGPQIAPILKEQISLVMEAYDPADKRDKVVIE